MLYYVKKTHKAQLPREKTAATVKPYTDRVPTNLLASYKHKQETVHNIFAFIPPPALPLGKNPRSPTAVGVPTQVKTAKNPGLK